MAIAKLTKEIGNYPRRTGVSPVVPVGQASRLSSPVPMKRVLPVFSNCIAIGTSIHLQVKIDFRLDIKLT